MRALRVTALAFAVCVGVASCSSSGSGAGPTSSTSSGTVAAVSENVSFNAGGTTTYGTLAIPAHRKGQHLAAALLLAGSGPTDRDGNQPSAGLTPDTLKLIAGVLGNAGIMTLRFDKYFSGQTGGTDPAALRVSTFLRQADAGYDFLRAQADTNQQQMLVVGHSEGGMYALAVADSVSPRPAGVALIEPQDQRLLTLIQVQTDEQLNQAVAAGQLSVAGARQNAAVVARAIGEFRAGHSVSLTGMLSGVASLMSGLLTGINAGYDRSDDDVYPPALAAQITNGTRVLVTDGTADTNVPPSTIAPLVRALASAGATGPGLVTLPGVNHELHLPGVGANDPVLAPSVISALQSWASAYAHGA